MSSYPLHAENIQELKDLGLVPMNQDPMGTWDVDSLVDLLDELIALHYSKMNEQSH